MNIRVNGQAKECAETARLNNIVEQFCRDSSRVIAELNGRIVRTDEWAATPVAEGDTIELVGFVGGG